jgi:hypothetical protein
MPLADNELCIAISLAAGETNRDRGACELDYANAGCIALGGAPDPTSGMVTRCAHYRCTRPLGFQSSAIQGLLQ